MHMFSWAVSEGFLAESPAVGLTKISSSGNKDRFRTLGEIEEIIARGGLDEKEQWQHWECLYLTPENIAELLQTVRANQKEDFSHLLHVIPSYTGMRRGEILRLRWIDIDFDQGIIVARSRKQSRREAETTRNIDMHPELVRELEVWRKRRARGQFVVCDKTLDSLEVKQANRSFWQPMRGTSWCLNGTKNRFKVGFHSYRHSFASNLAAAGVDQRIIDAWMGHQTEEMRKRYRHLFPAKRREAITTFSLKNF